MRLLLWLIALAALGAPALVLAQDYEMLTLAEAAYLHSGLALQAMLRNSSLKVLPQVIMVCGTIWLVYRRVISPRPQPLAGIVAYLLSCGIILVLFWPEAAPRFMNAGVNTKIVKADGSWSWVARANLAPIYHARDSDLVPTNLRGDAVVPVALDLILDAVTEMPLLLAEAVNPELKRAFSRMLPMRDFVEQVETKPPASLRTRMPTFVEECYRPAVEGVLKNNPDFTFDTGLSWSPAMQTALGRLKIAEKRGVADDYGTVPTQAATTCWAFYQDMEDKTVQYLRNQQTALGSNKARVVRQAMGLGAREQARVFVTRELQRQLQVVAGPSHVVDAKRAVDTASAASGALSQFNLLAPFKSVGTQLEKQLDRMSRFLGIGAFLVYWAPYIMGIAIFVVLGLFPVVLLWSLFPGQHFKPLVNYFLLLVFVCSTPLWWAMVDAAAEVAYKEPPPGDWFTAVASWGMAYTSYIVVTVLGIILVPVLQATLLFGTWRAIGGIWHG